MNLFRAVTIARRAIVAQYGLVLTEKDGAVVIAALEPVNEDKAAAYAQLGRLQQFLSSVIGEES